MNRKKHPYGGRNERKENTTIRTDPSELEDTGPKTAVELYKQARKNEIAEATRKSQHYRLKKFTQWCEDEDIENMNVLRGRTLYEFRIALQNGEYGSLKPYTIQGVMSTVRTFIAFAERIEACEGGLSDKVLIPTVDAEEKSRDTFLDAQRADDIRDHLRKFRYASRDHVVFEVLWYCGMRVGGLHSLDVGDFDADERRLNLKHRPNRETTLKNKERGERPVSLSDTVTEIVADYIDVNRIDAKDEYGREPLVTSTKGRMGKSQLRRAIGYVTQPCMIETCPHGRTPEDCEYRQYHDSQQCPSALPPHDIRRGSITHLKNQQVPTEVVSDRMNVDGKVLENHYDRRTPDEKMRLRREYLDELDL